MSQLSDFIDRAKLEALADDEYPVEHSGFTAPPPERCGCDECYVRSMERLSFLAGAAAYAALLDAEATEEWGVAYPNATWNAAPGYPMVEHLARELVDESEGVALVSRHVVRTPWLPSEGGEKRG